MHDLFITYRQFSLALDLGCGRGHVAKHITQGLTEKLYQCDYAERPLVGEPYTMYTSYKEMMDQLHVIKKLKDSPYCVCKYYYRENN